MDKKSDKTTQSKVIFNPRYRFYTVKDGDDLRLISNQAYGSPDFFLEIARANNLINFRRLSAGTELELPTIEKNDK